MVSMNNPGQQRAAFYEARARNYRRQAALLLERDNDLDSAGALLYESAKQCINALANRQGSNPASTGAKVRFLHGVAAQETANTDLALNWDFAAKLHIHADRGHLTRSRVMAALSSANIFIDQMLTIYSRAG